VRYHIAGDESGGLDLHAGKAGGGTYVLMGALVCGATRPTPDGRVTSPRLRRGAGGAFGTMAIGLVESFA